MGNPSVAAHAGIVPELACAFADPSGSAVAVSAANPLPVNQVNPNGGKIALTSGTTTNVAAVTTIKASAGLLQHLFVQNTAASARYFKLWDASGTITPGTTVATCEIVLAAGASIALPFPKGLPFANSLKWLVTAAKGLSDATATGLAAGDVTGFAVYE